MPKRIESPAVVEAAGTKPKKIEEYLGRVNTGHRQVSVARMQSPAGWMEPGQRPEFRELTLVLKGKLLVETEKEGTLEIGEGQAVLTEPGSGCATAPPRGRSTWRCACPRSPGPGAPGRGLRCWALGGRSLPG